LEVDRLDLEPVERVAPAVEDPGPAPGPVEEEERR
jgi:hypothetical protein